MISFVAETGLSFSFDLNELDGRTCNSTKDDGAESFCVGDWNASNTRQFLEYIRSNKLGAGLMALELGNELTRAKVGWKPVLTINQTIRDIHALSAVMDQVWQGDPAARPMLMGPATSECVEEDVRRILRETAGVLDIYSFHSYPDGSGSSHVSVGEIDPPNLWADLANATWLRQNGPASDVGYRSTYGSPDACVRAWSYSSMKDIDPSARRKKPELWLTETNAAYCELQSKCQLYFECFYRNCRDN